MNSAGIISVTAILVAVIVVLIGVAGGVAYVGLNRASMSEDETGVFKALESENTSASSGSGLQSKPDEPDSVTGTQQTDCGDYTQEHATDPSYLKKVTDCINQHTSTCTPASFRFSLIADLRIDIIGPEGNKCRAKQTLLSHPTDQNAVGKSMVCLQEKGPMFSADGTINLTTSESIDCTGELWNILTGTWDTSVNLPARDARRRADVLQLRTSLQSYYEKYSVYPFTLSALVPEFITKLPLDPAGSAYQYAACQNSYVVSVWLEDAANSELQSDIDVQTCGLNCADPIFCISK